MDYAILSFSLVMPFVTSNDKTAGMKYWHLWPEFKSFFFSFFICMSFFYPENGPSSGEDFHGLQPCTIGF